VRLQGGLLLKQAVEDVEAVAQRAGHDDGMEAGELVGQEFRRGVDNADQPGTPPPAMACLGSLGQA